LGGTTQRVNLSHLNNCIESGTDVIINCTGVHARTLRGVEDAEVYPTGGQIVIAQLSRVHLNWAFEKHPAFSNTEKPLSGL
jgi:D-amino-acid oxidase